MGERTKICIKGVSDGQKEGEGKGSWASLTSSTLTLNQT